MHLCYAALAQEAALRIIPHSSVRPSVRASVPCPCTVNSKTENRETFKLWGDVIDVTSNWKSSFEVGPRIMSAQDAHALDIRQMPDLSIYRNTNEAYALSLTFCSPQKAFHTFCCLSSRLACRSMLYSKGRWQTFRLFLTISVSV